MKEDGRYQTLILFMQGKAIWGAPIMNGTSQSPKPPVIIGITTKKIIKTVWAVTTTL